MHHYLSKPDYLAEVNEYLAKASTSTRLDFDSHMVLIEEEWANGCEPEDVARRILEGGHLRWETHRAQLAQHA
jgi:hypothetical protein